MFRSRNLTVFNSRGIRDTLRTDLYKNRALVPAFDKINLPVPDMPECSDILKILLKVRVLKLC